MPHSCPRSRERSLIQWSSPSKVPQTCPTLLCLMTSSMTSRSLLASVILRKRFNISPFSSSPFPFPPLSLPILSDRGSIFLFIHRQLGFLLMYWFRYQIMLLSSGFRCQPVFCKYQFYKQPEHCSMGREQRENVYWDDVNVVLLGIY